MLPTREGSGVDDLSCLEFAEIAEMNRSSQLSEAAKYSVCRFASVLNHPKSNSIDSSIHENSSTFENLRSNNFDVTILVRTSTEPHAKMVDEIFGDGNATCPFFKRIQADTLAQTTILSTVDNEIGKGSWALIKNGLALSKE